jgi:hypothetical protein
LIKCLKVKNIQKEKTKEKGSWVVNIGVSQEEEKYHFSGGPRVEGMWYSDQYIDP